ncbi:MAG TPA: hypothetical protein VF121_17765 [Thermoanaerobaculia bacterium]|nr:hypothetical protein [Thermoanaerobaculia bacterium]
MRQAEIEFWALGVIATVTAGGRIEDSRVELKAQWPDPIKAARRIAGHANAARGDDILWLIGVDEKQGVVGVNPDDLANWWAMTAANFEGPIPAITSVTVYQGAATVLALQIDSASAPFVVRNPVFGTTGGGPVELEVPWRDMTATRSARHGDLIRLLVPRLYLPSIEVLEATVSGSRPDPTVGRVLAELGPGFAWTALFTLYVVPHTSGLLVFPAHLIRVALKEPVVLSELELRYYGRRSGAIGDATADLVIEGPSRVTVRASADYDGTELPGDRATLLLRMVPAGSDQQIVITCELDRHSPLGFKLTRSSVSHVNGLANYAARIASTGG